MSSVSVLGCKCVSGVCVLVVSVVEWCVLR